MNWTLIIFGAIAVCICISVASSMADEEKKKSAAAKLPEALQKMMAEEFPAFAADFTYARSTEFLARHAKVSKSGAVRRHYPAFGGEVTKASARLAIGQIFARELAPIYSAQFAAFAQSNPEQFYAGLQRAITSARTLADA